jgi:alpha-beta hydrolase superfamily lysophospholipase
MVRKRAALRSGKPAETRGTVVLVHGYGQNRYAWHLPLRSVSNFLASVGYDVFNLELRGHGRSAHLGARRPSSPSEYVHEDLPSAIEEVLRCTTHPKVFLVGHSLGGLVAYASASILHGVLAGVGAIGSPYHFLRGAGGLRHIGRLIDLLEERVRPALFESDEMMDLFVVGEAVRLFRVFIESPLYPLPIRGYEPSNFESDVLAQHMSLAMDAGSVRVLRSMFRWARERRSDADSPGGVEGFGAAFEALRDLPLLVIAGSLDDLAPPEGVRSAYDRSQAIDKTYRCLPAGHVDLLVGTRAPQTTWPILEAWMEPRAIA